MLLICRHSIAWRWLGCLKGRWAQKGHQNPFIWLIWRLWHQKVTRVILTDESEDYGTKRSPESYFATQDENALFTKSLNAEFWKSFSLVVIVSQKSFHFIKSNRFCSSRDWGRYCEYIKRPGDIQVNFQEDLWDDCGRRGDGHNSGRNTASHTSS